MSTLSSACPCFPLINHYFCKKLSLYIQILNIYFGLGFEFWPKRIRHLASRSLWAMSYLLYLYFHGWRDNTQSIVVGLLSFDSKSSLYSPKNMPRHHCRKTTSDVIIVQFCILLIFCAYLAVLNKVIVYTSCVELSLSHWTTFVPLSARVLTWLEGSLWCWIIIVHAYLVFQN